MTASLYIHIPFCVKKCDYCAFVSGEESKAPQNMDEYLFFLYDELKKQLDFFKVDSVPSVYIGGGTPTLLGAKRLEALFCFLHKKLPPDLREITLEANPESLDGEIISVCEAAGVTRLSVGIQSLNGRSRKLAGRSGEPEEIIKKLNLLLKTKIDICFDLISGLPQQDFDSIYFDIQKLLCYNPAHISLYELILEEGTALFRKTREKKITLPTVEEREALWFYAASLLHEAGFEQYEVSAFARAEKFCIHNIRYWQMQNWLGVGRSASGTIIDDEACAGVRVCDGKVEKLGRETLLKETIMMGFRCIKGIDEALFKKRFKQPLSFYIPKTLAAWRAKGFLQSGNTAPKQSGLLWVNAIARDAFNELSALSNK
ncbi:MAG: radical SAM family heme chaperone HemW [Spirochaetaceae bacterium]|jgi:oxygen-independent coproporphyrinogen-3 oxidase|nr:radical SAM family heme chaperone HemW [Spirochaetaceae bacterium]